MTKGKVVVGMSGGVDSSVAAKLLQEAGYEVIGVTMQIWQETSRDEMEEDGGCCGLSAVNDARRVAFQLDIPYYVLNFKEDFQKHVISYFIEEYQQGRTPNPCIACNRYVKWEALFRRCREIGADYLATGHYARIEPHPETGRLAIRNSVSAKKDQTYVLYNLTQEQLSRTLMPVGEYAKDEIREIAAGIDEFVSQKADSQEICFVPDGDYSSFIARETKKPDVPGDFVDQTGKVLGKHKGITHYTVGQRKGLGVAFGKPMFVYAIDASKNQVVLCENDALFHKRVLAHDVNFMAFEKIDKPTRFLGKIRYNHDQSWCTAWMRPDGKLECVFDEPQRAITPGQAIVLYDGEYVACGGTIVSSEVE